MSAMLKEIGVDSYYLDINVERGAVSPATPPQMYWFNHEILGIRPPEDVKDPSLLAIYPHSSLGRVLIFDPTSEVTPLGQLSGHLQAKDCWSLQMAETLSNCLSSHPPLAEPGAERSSGLTPKGL